jgi:hypothetical protein
LVVGGWWLVVGGWWLLADWVVFKIVLVLVLVLVLVPVPVLDFDERVSWFENGSPR